MKKIKTIVALSCISMITITSLTGCGSKVSLNTALQNSATKMKSYSYTGKVDVTSSNNMLNHSNATLNFDGKTIKTENKQQNQTNLKFSTEDMKLEVPIFTEASLKDSNDLSIFVGLNGILEVANIPELQTFKDKNLYISAKDLKDTLKQYGGEDAVKDFDKNYKSSIESRDKAILVEKDFYNIYSKYAKEKGESVQKFKAIEKKSQSSNGVYEITLNKDDVKTVLTNYFKDETCMKDLKDFYATSGQADTIQPDKIIKDLDEGFKDVENLTLNTNITIEDNFITKYDVKFASEDENSKFNVNIELKLNDINKEIKIDMPKKDKNCISLTDIMKHFYNSFSVPNGAEVGDLRIDDADSGQEKTDYNVSVDSNGDLLIK